MNSIGVPGFLSLMGVLAALLSDAPAAPLELPIHAHPDLTRDGSWRLDPAKTAVVVIDMWDRHWCKTYTERVASMVPRMNHTLAAARKLGLTIVWAPSDVAEFYKDHPARRAIQAVPKHALPAKLAFDPPPAPKGDNCECGPNRPCRSSKVWTRQQAGLSIAEGDLLGDCNNAGELFNLCAERGLDTLVYMGVAANMCVCYRDFGMINLRRHGFRTLFVRDLVEAIMANGIDPVTRQPNPNFTPAKGSALAQAFLERHIAPSIESRQLFAAAGLAKHGGDERPHLAFVIADEEYESARTLPAFAETALGNEYRCSFAFSHSTNRNDVPGLDVLYDADLLVLSMRRRFLPVPQMDRLERFIRSGKPLVALRVSAAPFAEGAGLKRTGDGLVVWQNFDQEVLGCRYNFYDPAARKSGSDIWSEPAARQHPVLAGLADARFHTPAWIYRVQPLGEGTTVLMKGRWSDQQPEEPVAWTTSYNGGRVFYTSLGHPQDFERKPFQRLLRNAIDWALDRPRH